jgi:hypothetical protein
MNTIIQDDFQEFITNEDLFSSGVKLYDSKGGSLVFEGSGIFDRKPMLVENENGQFAYQGHRSILSLSMADLTFMTNYHDINGYYVEVTDNIETKAYFIENSPYNSNVNKIYCELKLEQSV